MRPAAIVVALVALWPTALIAADRGPVGLPCRAPDAAVRSGTFNLLGSGATVRLKAGKGCIPLEARRASPCEWAVEATRIEQWGRNRVFLLVSVEVDHVIGSGAYVSIFIYRCNGTRYEQVFADQFEGGATAELGTRSDLWLTASVWDQDDPHCCPTRERRMHYAWNAKQQRFVKLSSITRPAQP